VIEHTPIFVTGCRRSGLSMTSAILYLHGVWTGENKAQKINKMSFKNKRLWDEGFLIFLTSSKKSLNFEKGFDELRIRSHIESLLIHQGFRGGYWLLKNHALIEYQDIISAIFPNAIWIHVRRNADEILKSCLKTFPLGLRKTEEEWRHVISEAMKKMDDFSSRKSVYTVYPEKFFNNDFSEIENVICQGLKLDWMGGAVKELFKRANRGKSNNS